MRSLHRLGSLLMILALAALGCLPSMAQTDMTTAAVPVSRRAEPRRPWIITQGLEWLPEVVEADDFAESPSETTITLPYEQAAEGLPALPASARTFQPSGALSGKIVYLMAGHGWTYNDSTQSWYTQRGPLYGMIEDLGNLDQMHIFAHLVWNAGGTVVPLRPVDHQPEERIVDNSMSQATFYGPWADSVSKVYHGTPRDRVPYRFAYASLEETAVARFRPWIPKSGDYPVYAWVRDGRDRVNQLYRVHHAGGVTEVRVNHRLVGKGWIWLGTYRFHEGDTGFVEISNQVTDPYQADGSHVVVADAIRFGNGRGNAQREGGISNYLREDEGDAYWIASSLPFAADRRLYTSGRTDGNATVSAPPKTVAYMNRESEGLYTDRVLISFHSNASSGRARGAIGLFNASPRQRPDYQELLADLTARQINVDLVSSPPIPGLEWGARDRHTYNGINFGELRKDYLQNEVCATIVEVAFHDNPEDVAFLLDPRARIAAARATLRGLLKWFDLIEKPRHATEMPPSAPRELRALPGPTSGSVVLSWEPGPVSPEEGNAASDYRVFVSRDGRAFDGGVLSNGATTISLTVPSTTAPLYARVSAVNASGESLPGGVVAVRVQGDPEAGSERPVLIVDAMTTLDRRLNAPYHKHVVDPENDRGYTVQRVRPLLLNQGEAVVRTAEALTTAGVTFATVPPSAVANGDVVLAKYAAVVWLAGRQGPELNTLIPDAQRRLSEYVRQGGRLFLSGSHLAEALAAPSPEGTTEQSGPGHQFLAQLTASSYETSNPASRRLAPSTAGSELPPLELEQENATPYLPDALPTDVLAADETRGARELLQYRWPSTGAAAVASDSAVIFGFPFESIQGEETRAQVMRAVLRILGVTEGGATER